VPSKPLPEVDFGIVRVVVEAILRLVAHRLGPELNLLLPAEMVDGLERVLESISPAARHAVVGLAPTEFVNEAPSPLPPVRQHQIHHVQVPLAFIGVRLDVQEVGTVRRQHRLDPAGHRAEPLHVLFGRHRLEAAGRVILALRGVRRRRNHYVRLLPVEQSRQRPMIAAVPADQPVFSDQPDVSGPRYRVRRRLGDFFFRRAGRLSGRFGIGQELGQFLLGEAQQIEPPVGGLQFRRVQPPASLRPTRRSR
jgi:hypothetical protein